MIFWHLKLDICHSWHYKLWPFDIWFFDLWNIWYVVSFDICEFWYLTFDIFNILDSCYCIFGTFSIFDIFGILDMYIWSLTFEILNICIVSWRTFVPFDIYSIYVTWIIWHGHLICWHLKLDVCHSWHHKLWPFIMCFLTCETFDILSVLTFANFGI